MDDILSWFKDLGSIMSDWQAWLGALILSSVSLLILNKFSWMISVPLIIFSTYTCILLLNMFKCKEKLESNKLSFKKMAKDKDYWLATLYSTSIFVTVFILGGLMMIKMNLSNIFQFIFALISTIAFYTIYTGFRELITCSDYENIQVYETTNDTDKTTDIEFYL